LKGRKQAEVQARIVRREGRGGGRGKDVKSEEKRGGSCSPSTTV
jgi:hypothetical protein